ncbi:sensor histidine kinase [Pontibacter fetidus]|uniref:Oxygen sensor histidine kinase NreB n=1 Tax=Pontibacter fetidus TaxID=2700082 RepID=A0A6B2HBU6_9BACT|nr:sensor histidine kinase [Pontibacter fetidus]NDK57432.1 sensor histidine kinase [Pontibacter fetidus]
MIEILKPVIIITPVLLVLAIGIILFVFKYQRRMLQHQEHVRHLQEIRQRQLLDATIQAEEEERRRVARDLHDEVGAMLALVKLNVHQLTAQSENKESGQQVKKMLDDVMGSVRQISHNLMPVVLEKMGLGQALEAMRRAIPAASGVALTLTCNQPDKRIEPKTELFLYRVVQELLNNTLKHAQASEVQLSLQYSDKDLLLTYQDNGNGFDYNSLSREPNSGGGLGLMNLQARLELLNGKFDFFSALNSGTKAIISVPIS